MSGITKPSLLSCSCSKVPLSPLRFFAAVAKRAMQPIAAATSTAVLSALPTLAVPTKLLSALANNAVR